MAMPVPTPATEPLMSSTLIALVILVTLVVP